MRVQQIAKFWVGVYQSVHRGDPEARIAVLGAGPLSELRVSHSDHWLSLEPGQQRVCEEAVEALRARGLTVTSDPIYRVLDCGVDEGFELTLGRGNYSQVVGLKANPQWGIQANVLAVGCVLECPQGFVIERRSELVAALPGRLHIAPCGSVQPPNSIVEALMGEALEELGLNPQEILGLRCLGILFVETVGVFLLVCSAHTEVTLSEIQGRERSGAWEQEELLCAPADRLELPPWLQEHRQQLTGGGRAALLMEGHRRWGADWFNTHLEDAP